MNWLFCEPNPISINTALMMTGAVNPVFRLPNLPLNDDQQQIGLPLINQLNEADVVGGKACLLNSDEVLTLS
jgi:4-hydroxy-tetrahydrodipicolinate synthase